MIQKIFSIALALPLAAAVAQAQTSLLPTATAFQASFARGPVALFLEVRGGPAGVGDVGLFSEDTGVQVGSPARLQNVRLLPLDFVGRTDLLAFEPDRPRYRSDVTGASRLALQGGLGSLYRFERIQAGNASIFGFFLLTRGGGLHVFGEKPGTGLVGLDDPWLGRIAVSPDGRSVLAATTTSAAGDLFEFALPTGAPFLRTATLPPLDFSDSGLWLADDWGFGVSASGVVRFDRVAHTVDVMPFLGAAPSWFSGDAVMSSNREWGALTAGDGPTSAHVWAFSKQGEARRATPAPAWLSGAGFLPESLVGPFLAVSDDGALCAWRQHVGMTTEAFVGDVEPVPPVPVQVSSDVYFVDTLDSVGGLTFFTPTRLLMAIGEVEDPVAGGIEKSDLFHVEMQSGAPVFSNLSQTSGQVLPPFLAIPSLEPEVMHWSRDAQKLLIFDADSEALVAVDPAQPGVQVLLSSVKELDFVEPVGQDVLVAVRREFQPRPRELHRLSSLLASPASIVVQGTPDTTFLSPSPRGTAWVGMIVDEDLLGQTMTRLNVAAGTVQSFNLPPTQLGPSIGYSPRGSQIFSIEAPRRFVVWPFQGAPVLLLSLGAAGHVLPSR